MLAAPGRVTKVLEFNAMETARLNGPGAPAKVTPVVVQEGWASSAVAVPLLVTLYTWTG
jgi:hypothetical protein